MLIHRHIRDRIATTRKSVLLLGPRQTGKSTLLAELKPDLTINLARESEFLAFARNPAELEARIRGARARTVLIDEIQRLPNLTNTVQALIDAGNHVDAVASVKSGAVIVVRGRRRQGA